MILRRRNRKSVGTRCSPKKIFPSKKSINEKIKFPSKRSSKNSKCISKSIKPVDESSKKEVIQLNNKEDNSMKNSPRNIIDESFQSHRILRSGKKSFNSFSSSIDSISSGSKMNKTHLLLKGSQKKETSCSKKMSAQDESETSCVLSHLPEKTRINQHIFLRSFDINKNSKKMKTKRNSKGYKGAKNKSDPGPGFNYSDIHTPEANYEKHSKLAFTTNKNSTIFQKPFKAHMKNKVNTDPILKNQPKTDLNVHFPNMTMAPLERSSSFGYYLRSIPVDDITVISCSTPNTCEKLFTNCRTQKNLNSSFLNKKPVLGKRRSSRYSDGIISKNVVATKGTLKRKRLMINSLKERNEGYEDDIFENKKLAKINNTLKVEEDEDSDFSSFSISTPKLTCIVPIKAPSKTPRFKDCYSPSELSRARKVAEEYIHRRNKKKKGNPIEELKVTSAKKNSKLKNNFSDSTISPEKKKLEFDSLMGRLKDLSKNKETGSDSEVDEYFSDA